MGLKSKNLGTPDESGTFPHGSTVEVHLGEFTIGRNVHEPGFRWSTDLKPIVGTPTCQFRHIGTVISGRSHVVFDDGTEGDLRAGDVFEIPPGHDAWVIGDEPFVTLEWAGVHGWTAPPSGERVLATLLFTDIVESTHRAERLGDRAWARLLDDHNAAVRGVLERFRGREVDHTGDGIFAMFDGAERCVRAAAAIRRALEPLQLAIRAGVHTGEVEVLPGGNLRGLAVHTAARIMALASPGEVLVSGSTRDLVDAPDLQFVDRGAHELRGVTRARQLYALDGAPSP